MRRLAVVLAAPLLLACDALRGDPPPTAPVVTPTAPAATSTAPAVTPTAPAATPTAPAVTPTAPAATPVDTPPAASATTWWCLCYAMKAAPFDRVTTCRAEQAQCTALEHKVADAAARGLGRIAPGSLSHACRAVHGATPEAALGGGSVIWSPSEKEGGWFNRGGCLLPGPADRVPGDPAVRAAYLLELEAIGEYHIDMPAADVEARLGAPEPFEHPAHGAMSRWPKAGLTFAFRPPPGGEPGAAPVVGLIVVEPPCTLATAAKVRLGATRQEVEAAYAGMILRGESTDAQLSVGSPIERIAFDFEAGRLTRIVFEPNQG